MNNLVIPPSANWYEASILACAPDNTLIYGSRNDIVVIFDTPDDQPSDVKIIPRAHSQKIVSTNINRNWGHPHKLLVTTAEDNIVKLWDIVTRKKKLGHNAHVRHGKVIGATFAGDDRIISVSEDGIIIVWNINSDQPNVLKDVFGSKVTVTCISTCPHANWLTAFGLRNGLVVVTDLRKQGKVLYKLRGHDKSILSLSWCPAPVNVFPKNPHNYVDVKNSNVKVTEVSLENKGETSAESRSHKVSEMKPRESLSQENENVRSGSVSKSKIPKKMNKNNIWSNLKHVDDDELGVSHEENILPAVTDDFLTECMKMKGIITRQVQHHETTDRESHSGKNRIIIKANRRQPTSTKNETEEFKDYLKSTQITEDVSGEVKNDFQIVTPPTTKDAEGAKLVLPSLDITNAEYPSDCSIKETSFESRDALTDEQQITTEAGEENICGELIIGQDSNKTTSEAKREIPLNIPAGEEPRREFLLASSGKEGNIYIWRAGTDGRMQTLLSVPNKAGQRRSGKSSSDKLWIVLCWISPTVLLSASKSAELVKWTLPKPKDKNKQFSIVHCDHNSMLFSITAPIVLLNEYNWLDERKLNVWTVGHDRLLLNTSLTSERKNLACYPTLGNAECFALSPVDPNRLAIGTAEGMIKVWDLSRPNIKNIVMTSFFQKIQSKVVTLAWHPTNELILAYGTLEGRVGVMDTSNKSKTPTVTQHFFKTQIHKVEWAPVNGNKEDFGLYVVAEGKLVLYSMKKSEKAPIEVDTPDDTFVYTFAWKPDYTMLLVGTRTGTIILYSPDLKILSTHYFQHRLKDIYWHPDAVHSDLGVSERCYWFAAISNSKEVVVCNFQREIDDGEKIVTKFDQSEDMINSVSWSPYKANELVIASDEGTAQVWDVARNTIKSTYISPNFEGVLSAIWSPIDSGCIISAVKDHTIKVWRILDHPKRDDKELKELRKKVIKEITKEQMDLLPKAEKPQEETPKAKITKTNLLPNFFYPKDVPQVIGDLRKLFLWKEGAYSEETGGGDNNYCDILKIFGSKNDMLSIIEKNEAIHQEKGKYSLSNTLSLFKGDISTKIKKAVDERRVNPWIIMMAPMVSPKLWQSACEVYAQQLSETADSDPVEIATFYLVCHKIEEAIDVLCEGTMYREALALAKCRLPEDNPTIAIIMEKWAKYSVAVGNFEAAAQCYICLNKYEDAASVLFRRSDIETLKFAMELAEKSGNEELHKAVLFRYNAFRNEDGVEAKELPSKLDVVLKQHLDTELNDKKAVLEDLEDSDEKCNLPLESQNGEEVSLGNDEIEELMIKANKLNENISEENLQIADKPVEKEILATDNAP